MGNRSSVALVRKREVKISVVLHGGGVSQVQNGQKERRERERAQ